MFVKGLTPFTMSDESEANLSRLLSRAQEEKELDLTTQWAQVMEAIKPRRGILAHLSM